MLSITFAHEYTHYSKMCCIHDIFAFWNLPCLCESKSNFSSCVPPPPQFLDWGDKLCNCPLPPTSYVLLNFAFLNEKKSSTVRYSACTVDTLSVSVVLSNMICIQAWSHMLRLSFFSISCNVIDWPYYDSGVETGGGGLGDLNPLKVERPAWF